MKHTICFATLAALAASCNALAVGGIAEVTIIDRSTGVALTPHLYRGEYWVAGKPGATYAIEIRNHLDQRLLAVTAVDGVNVISGATAAWGQTGYVFNPGQDYRITGWRKSDREVAAFTFTAAPNSYAARTGRPANVGIIGVALFRERQPQEVYIPPAPQVAAPVPSPVGAPTTPPVATLTPAPILRPAPSPPEPPQAKKTPAAGHQLSEVVVTGQARPRESESAAPIAAQTPFADAPASAPLPEFSTRLPDSLAREDFSGRATQSPKSAEPAATPKLGTGHGEREYSYVTNTEFDRMQTQPNEVIRIRYDSLDNLIAMGIVEPFRPAVPAANPFPASAQQQYVPDPPAGVVGEVP
jgi:hypothetical protein